MILSSLQSQLEIFKKFTSRVLDASFYGFHFHSSHEWRHNQILLYYFPEGNRFYIWYADINFVPFGVKISTRYSIEFQTTSSFGAIR